MQVLLRQIIELFSSLDPTQIVTTAMIVGGTSFVTLYIYFDSIKPKFRIQRVEEPERRLIRINDISKSIRRCSISIDGTKLRWTEINSDETYFAAGEGGNAVIPRDMVVADHSLVKVKNGWRTLDKMRYRNIPPTR